VGVTALALPGVPTASLRELVSTGTGPSAPRDRTAKTTAALAVNSQPRESFAGSQGVNEDDDGVSLSRCHACGEELALLSCDDCRRLNLAHICATHAGDLTASSRCCVLPPRGSHNAITRRRGTSSYALTAA
jgi:hypothetical protein